MQKKTKHLTTSNVNHKAIKADFDIIKPDKNHKITTPEFKTNESNGRMNFGEWIPTNGVNGKGNMIKTIIMLGVAMVAGMLLMVLIDILD